MGFGRRQPGRFLIGIGGVVLACAIFLFAHRDDTYAQGDAIIIGRSPPAQEKHVKETELAPGGGEEKEAQEGGREGAPPDDFRPKDEPGLPGEMPVSPAGKEGAPGEENGKSARREPEFPLEEHYLRFQSADSVKYDKKKKLLTLSGDVVIEIEETTLTADYVEVDDLNKEIYARGHVAVWQGDDIIFGDEVFLNYDTEYFRVTNPSGNTSGPEVNGHVYFEGTNLEGTFDRYVIDKAKITSCEPFCALEEYHIRSQKVIVKPDKQMVLEHNYTYIRGTKVFYWPLLVVPLRKKETEQDRGPFEQNYGRNQTEGWFAKYAWTYKVRYAEAIRDPLISVAVLEFMEEKGVNVGQRQDYYINGLGVGTVKFEYLFSNESAEDRTPSSNLVVDGSNFRFPSQDGDVGKKPKDFSFDLKQELLLSPEMTGSFSLSRTDRYNIYRTRTNTFRTTFSLARTVTDWTTNLSFNHGWTASSSTGTGGKVSKNVTTSGSFRNTYKLSNDMSWVLSQTFSANKNISGKPADQEGVFTSTLNYNPQKYSVNLEWREEIDFDDDTYLDDLSRNVRHHLPKLDMTIKRRNWKGSLQELSDIKLSLTNTRSGPRNEVESIVHAKLNTSASKKFQFDRYSSLSTSLSFEQNIYDDGNALYAYKPSIKYRYNSRKMVDFSLNWTLSQFEGRKSPNVTGSFSRNSRISGNLGLTNRRTWNTDFNTTFDIKKKKWTPVTLKFSWDPNDNLGMTFETGWDIEKRNFKRIATLVTGYYADSGNWSVFSRSKFRFSKPESGFTHNSSVISLDSIDLSYNRLFTRNWEFNVTSNFIRGKQKQKIIDRLSLTKTNCCTTFQFGYNATRKEYFLQVFINAFPGKSSTFSLQEDDFSLSTPFNQLLYPQTYLSGGGYYF